MHTLFLMSRNSLKKRRNSRRVTPDHLESHIVVEIIRCVHCVRKARQKIGSTSFLSKVLTSCVLILG